MKDCLLVSVSPSPSLSRTVSLTYLAPVTLNAFFSVQPVRVSNAAVPFWSSNDHVQEIGPSPVERVPSSVTVTPTLAPRGGVQSASAAVSGVGVVLGVGVGLGLAPTRIPTFSPSDAVPFGAVNANPDQAVDGPT